MVTMVIVLVGANAQADITFDFDALHLWQGDAAISSYMTDTYGSSVTTDDAITGIGFDFSSTPFIGNNVFSGWDGDFDVFFNVEPVIGVQFRGYVFYPSCDADFVLRAFSEGDEVLTYTRNNCIEAFDSGWLAFEEEGTGTPILVDQLQFSNCGIHAVGIDNLTVRKGSTVIPAPSAAVLALVGFSALGAATKLRKR
jgi:hypothetical protein